MYKIIYAHHEYCRRFGCVAKSAEEAAACLPTGCAYDADAAKNTIVETTSRYFELSRKLTCGKTMVVQCDGFNYIE